MNKIITPEERKKWILEHPQNYIEYRKCEIDAQREKEIKDWEEQIGLKYSPELEEELYSRYFEKDRRKKIISIEERYQKRLSHLENINGFLNNEKLLNEKEQNCDEKVDGIDISKYLDLIRYNHEKELDLYLFIKDSEIIDKYFVEGDIRHVNTNKEHRKAIYTLARKYEADIYNVHNHPLSFVAFPSILDFKARSIFSNEAKINGFNCIDWGVVTEWDYYSNKQKKRMNP